MRSLSQTVPLAAVSLLATGVQSQIFSQNPAYPIRPFGSSFGTPAVNATYDYIVVGGGTAGLTLASRLVEQNAGSVAVIEAGTFYEMYGNTSQVPAYAATWIGKSPEDSNPAADWDYVTTPQAVSDITDNYSGLHDSI
jgi:choline dehydrogenase